MREEWFRRVEAEYRSAAHAHTVTGWLIEVGGPPELIVDGLRIVADELAHAELSAGVVDAAGGGPTVALDRSSLRLLRTEPVEVALIQATLELFCVGETIAVPLFRRMLAGASEPVARVALRRIVADEARHRRFGWDMIEWFRFAGHSALVDTVVARELPAMIGRVRGAYGQSTVAEITPDARAWGLIPGAEYGAVLSRVERDWWGKRLGWRG